MNCCEHADKEHSHIPIYRATFVRCSKCPCRVTIDRAPKRMGRLFPSGGKKK